MTKVDLKILAIFIFLTIISLLIFDLVFSDRKIIFIKELKEKIEESLYKEEAILFLGKMGGYHYGAENTDAIFVVYLKEDHLFIIHIPRDLLVNINGDFYKINSLWGLNKKEELLREVSLITGLKIKKYIVIDSYLIKSVVNQIGGLKVNLIYPVTDAVSGYTLKPGLHVLSGEWVEFVVRSRYYPDGDFTRMKNQFIIIKSLKEQLSKEPVEKLLSLVNFVIGLKNHYETNLSYGEIIKLLGIVGKIPNKNFKEILVGYDKNLWQDGNFEIKINNHKDFAYGLIPQNGAGEYSTIRKIIREKIKEEIAKEH